jgi:hypothetical protein
MKNSLITFNETSDKNNLIRIQDIEPNDYKIIGTMWSELTYNGDFNIEFDIDSSYDEKSFKKTESCSKIVDMMHAKVAKCNHCNKRISYVMIGLHNDGTINIFGIDCTKNIVMYKGLSFESIKKRSLNSMVREKNANKRELFLGIHEGLKEALQTRNPLIQKINEQFTAKCKLSEKQIELIFKLEKQHKDFIEKNKQRDLTALDVPEIRVVNNAFKVISIKKVGDNFGFKYKTVLESVEGFYRVYGNLPVIFMKKFGEIKEGSTKVGDIINITTTLTKSADNPKFGYFKRTIGCNK